MHIETPGIRKTEHAGNIEEESRAYKPCTDKNTYEKDIEFLHTCICALSAGLIKEAEKNLEETSKKDIMKQSFQKGVRTCLEYMLKQGDSEWITKARKKQEESIRSSLRKTCCDEKKIDALIKAMSSKDEELLGNLQIFGINSAPRNRKEEEENLRKMQEALVPEEENE